MPLYPFDPTNDDHSPLNNQPSTSDGIDYTQLIGSYNEDGILEFNPAGLDDSVTDPNTPTTRPMDGDLYNQLRSYIDPDWSKDFSAPDPADNNPVPTDILSSANPWLQGLGITSPPGAGNFFDGFSSGNNVPSWGANLPNINQTTDFSNASGFPPYAPSSQDNLTPPLYPPTPIPSVQAINSFVNRPVNPEGDLTYPDGIRVIDPNTQKPYPLPEGLNVTDNVTKGENANIADMLLWFPHGMSMDYQRANSSFNGNYRNVTNYNFGAVSAAAGYSLEDALNNAGWYNRYLGHPQPNDTIYGIRPESVNSIVQGWNDYKNEKWKRLPSSKLEFHYGVMD